MQPVVYRRRRDAISRGERQWRADDDALVTIDTAGSERRFAWKNMIAVRLCFEPRRFRPFRYVLEFTPKKGRKITLDNAHYLGVGRFEDRSDTYTPFVRSAIERLRAVKPNMHALIGETPKRYFFLLLVSLFILGGIALALVTFPTPIDGLPYANLIKFGIILLMLPIFWRVLGAMPKGVPLDDIPKRALPPG
jgi:hypothetical protein